MNGDKGQGVRLLDIFVLGPFMIWFGVEAKGLNQMSKNTMIAAGISTIVYNARNFLIKQQSERKNA